ncbi:U-box domain-containing protein [Striga asiatica]|uniref:26S proteasome complex subunit SEM1 n=1 Tax=Striga asiatica TaxID=4170 RepID=A0A5A7RI73_STRAF|nr:U-box domain-containing protein [Striga asiatica]
MIQKSHRSDRRFLEFPAVHPCEGISPVTLLESLINLSKSICIIHQSKPFPTHRKNARETSRQISILSIFFEEIRDQQPENFSDGSIVLCLSDLHVALQKIRFLFEDCTRDGAKTLILMRSHFVTTQFRALVRAVATAFDILPLSSVELSGETKELVEMLSKQARKAKIEVDPGDECAMKRMILVLNQFENKLEPDPFIARRILAHLGIKTWAECHEEVKFLDEEIRAEYSNGNEREIPLLSSLLGFLSYCRGVLFDECDFVCSEVSEGRDSNFEVLSCLNLEDFRCPISLELMTDPVTVSTGQTYDRVSIQKWLKSGNLICPKTGEKLTSTDLVPNASLRKLIQQFCAEYGVSLSKSRKKNRDISRTILPGSPSNAEAIKFLSGFLTVSLGFGNERQKKKAAHEIRLLAKSNIYNRTCLIESGAIFPLLELLCSDDPAMQENAISGLLKLSKQPKGAKSIIENGGFSLVLQVLKNGLTPESKQTAAATIFYLSSSHENRKLIGENKETIPSLLELVKEGTSCGKKNSVVAIFALLFYHKNRQRAILANAVPILIKLLELPERAELKADALAVLSALADSVEGSFEFVRAEGLTLTLRLLHSMETRASKEYCVSILHSLCLNCGQEVVSVLAKDVSLMPALYTLLTDGTSHAGKKSRSLIKILQRFFETRSSCLVREEMRQEVQHVDARLKMATEQPKPATEGAKIDLFEDDDEFEEFEVDQEWNDDKELKEITQQWEDDWDDDDVNDDFSLQLRRELEGNAEKK